MDSALRKGFYTIAKDCGTAWLSLIGFLHRCLFVRVTSSLQTTYINIVIFCANVKIFSNISENIRFFSFFPAKNSPISLNTSDFLAHTDIFFHLRPYSLTIKGACFGVAKRSFGYGA